MTDILYIVRIIQASIFILIVPFPLLYLLTIISIKRFHTANNILTANFCLCCLITPILITLTVSAGQILNCLVVHSLVAITISRCFTICFPMKRFFKSKTWIYLSIILQWIFTLLISILIVLNNSKESVGDIGFSSWIWSYTLSIIVIIPVIVNIIFNGIIVVFVRSSSRRVHEITVVVTSITNTNHQQHRRDIKLLKHIIFLFIVFILGWGPLYIVLALTDLILPDWLYSVLQIPPTFATIIQVVDLFIYNHEVRQYWKERINRCFDQIHR
ncbi:hypothetical protein I4U23_017008 [Adineta vaga]|nr:hypothetical protein I4U23_016474 [Adineta vaga]UJR12834.1 hypothetical protein I4U23_017008 [Adineta vaga]